MGDHENDGMGLGPRFIPSIFLRWRSWNGGVGLSGIVLLDKVSGGHVAARMCTYTRVHWIGFARGFARIQCTHAAPFCAPDCVEWHTKTRNEHALHTVCLNLRGCRCLVFPATDMRWMPVSMGIHPKEFLNLHIDKTPRAQGHFLSSQAHPPKRTSLTPVIILYVVGGSWVHFLCV